jgi:hypothetical protein
MIRAALSPEGERYRLNWDLADVGLLVFPKPKEYAGAAHFLSELLNQPVSATFAGSESGQHQSAKIGIDRLPRGREWGALPIFVMTERESKSKSDYAVKRWIPNRFIRPRSRHIGQVPRSATVRDARYTSKRITSESPNHRIWKR